MLLLVLAVAQAQDEPEAAADGDAAGGDAAGGDAAAAEGRKIREKKEMKKLGNMWSSEGRCE